jgi:hypothetical protein
VNLGNKLELLYCEILLHKYSKELRRAYDIHSSFLQIRIVSGSVLACSIQASCASLFGFLKMIKKFFEHKFKKKKTDFFTNKTWLTLCEK